MATKTIDIDKIARVIKNARIARGLTQQQLAALAGLSLRSVQRIEAAEGSPRRYTLDLLAQKLEISVDLVAATAESPAALSDEHLIAPVPVLRHGFNRSQKIIASIFVAAIITLLTTAYIFQSPTFPESAFEMVLLLAVLMAVYGAILIRIWR